MGTVGGNLCLDTRCIFYNQSEWWRARQQSLPQDHGRHLPCRAEEPRRVLRDLQRRSRAGVSCRSAPRSTSRGRRAAAPLPLDKLYIGYARQDSRSPRRSATASISSSLRPGEFVTAVRAKHAPGLRSGYDKIRIRRSIEYPVAGVAVALRRDGDMLADLRVAFTGTNPRPVLLDGTANLCGGAARRTVLQGLDDLVRDQVMAMKTTFTPGHYRRRVAGVLARRRRAAIRGLNGAKTLDALRRLGRELLTDDFSRRRPYNAASDFVDANVARGLGDKVAFIDPERSLTYGELQARSCHFARALEPGSACTRKTASRPAATTRSTIRSRSGARSAPASCHPAQHAADARAICLHAGRQPRDRARGRGAARPVILPILDRAAAPAHNRAGRRRTVDEAGALRDLRRASFRGLARRASSRTLFTAPTISDEVAFWLYTSGSTGDPKGVKHVHTSLMATARLMGQGVLGIARGRRRVLGREAVLRLRPRQRHVVSDVGRRHQRAAAAPADARRACSTLMRRAPPDDLLRRADALRGAARARPTSRRGAGSDRLRLCVSAGEALPAHIGERWRRPSVSTSSTASARPRCCRPS